MEHFDDSDDLAAVPLSQRAMAARPAPYLDGLNAAQRAAVEALDGPVLMLAGAGTGKTRALTTRIAHLLMLGKGTARVQLLAVTFTNKAAREMKDRIGRLLGDAVEGMPWLGTFHSISVKILRRHAELIGHGNLHLKPSFTILDTDDQIRLLKQLIAAENIDEKRWPARQLAHLIDGWKNRCITPGNLPRGEGEAFDGHGGKLYAAYQDRLLTLNAVDFGDLLLHCVTLFQGASDVLRQWRDGSAISLRWMSIRTPTPCSTPGCGCLRRRIATSAAWATTTSRSTAGAGPRWATSCGSRRTFRAPR